MRYTHCCVLQTLNLTDTAGTVFLNGHISFLGADLVPGNSTVGPESGLSLLSDLVGIAIQDFALPDMNRVRRRVVGISTDCEVDSAVVLTHSSA